MAKKLSNVVGIDIGSQTIKVAELRTQNREPMVTAIGMIETPEGAVDHTGIFNAEAVGTAIKQLLSQSGVTIGQAVATISGQSSVLVRTLPVPRMNPNELKEHMQWEINRNIPFAESNVVSDYKALADEDPNSAEMDVVMAISPQSAIDTLVGCLKKAGRSTVAIDVEPLSLARSVDTSYQDVLFGKTVCVVDMGHKTTAINIYKDGKLLMPRQIPLGGEMFTKAIADHLALSIEQAEVAKRERAEVPSLSGPMPTQSFTPLPAAGDEENPDFVPYNPFSDEPAPEAPAFEPEPAPSFEPDTEAEAFNPFADEPAPVPAAPTSDPFTSSMPVPAGSLDDEQQNIWSAISPVVDEFVAEVRRSVDYYTSRGGLIDKVILCGGGTKVKGLVAYVSNSLAIPTEAYNAFRNLRINERKVAPGFAEESGQDFAIAVGNGLHIFYD